MVFNTLKRFQGPSGLGIMIIEGRHTEAGRGIFVSDLQEGSAAEQVRIIQILETNATIFFP